MAATPDYEASAVKALCAGGVVVIFGSAVSDTMALGERLAGMAVAVNVHVAADCSPESVHAHTTIPSRPRVLCMGADPPPLPPYAQSAGCGALVYIRMTGRHAELVVESADGVDDLARHLARFMTPLSTLFAGRVFLVCGPAGSGKSQLAHRLTCQLGGKPPTRATSTTTAATCVAAIARATTAPLILDECGRDVLVACGRALGEARGLAAAVIVCARDAAELPRELASHVVATFRCECPAYTAALGPPC